MIYCGARLYALILLEDEQRMWRSHFRAPAISPVLAHACITLGAMQSHANFTELEPSSPNY